MASCADTYDGDALEQTTDQAVEQEESKVAPTPGGEQSALTCTPPKYEYCWYDYGLKPPRRCICRTP